MDKRDKPSVSFRAADGMSGKMDKSPNGPAAGRGFRDYKGGSSDGPPKKLGTTPSSTGVGKNMQRGNGGRHK